MVFKYSGFNKSGQEEKGTIEASDIEEAKTLLKNRDIFYETLKPSINSFWSIFSIRKTRELPKIKLIRFSQNLSIYLKADIPIIKAIFLLKGLNRKDKIMQEFFFHIEKSLSEGYGLYQALIRQNEFLLPGFYTQSVKIAEERGLLADVLEDLSALMEELENTQETVNQALIYPTFIIFLSFFLVFFMLSVVVPKIKSIFDQIDQTLPSVTLFIIYAGDFVSDYWLMILLILLLIVLVFKYLRKNSNSFAYYTDMIILKMPFFGTIVLSYELARFSKIISMMMRSGTTLVHAIRISSNLFSNKVLQEDFKNASENVIEGDKFSSALLKNAKNIDISFVQAIALAEESSEVSNVLEKLAILYSKENKTRINIFLSLLGPVLILFVGAIIGFIVTAMLLPIFSMNFNI